MKYDYYAKKLEALWLRRKWWILGVGMMVVLIGLSQYGKHRSVSDVFRARVESHLSNFNGSHDKLEAYIKATMNDPDSYEHVSTQYIMPKDTGVTSAIFVTTFRGKNAFGGVITQTIRARCNIETGEVESVISK